MASTWRCFIRAIELLFIGRPALEKGLADLLEALEVLRSLPWHLSVVGEPPTLAALQADTPRITCHGPLPHHVIPQMMRDHDVLVVPSRYETFGNVALEGLASGMIVIASRTGGLKAIIDHGRSGFHFTPCDTGNLACVLAHVIKDEGSLANIRLAARAEASNYSWDVVASATAILLARIL